MKGIAIRAPAVGHLVGLASGIGLLYDVASVGCTPWRVVYLEFPQSKASDAAFLRLQRRMRADEWPRGSCALRSRRKKKASTHRRGCSQDDSSRETTSDRRCQLSDM